ncbi:MAG TPA: GTPase [Phycisphaerae bacterium]|nr:GTPase [Phycisphaerae bacterium]
MSSGADATGGAERAGRTTACLQTPPGTGGIAVIALRGPQAGAILGRIFHPLPSHAAAGPGRLQLGHVVVNGEVIDEAIVRAQACAADVNIHGGPQIAKAVLQAVADCGATIEASAALDDADFPPAHPRWSNPAIGREMLDVLPMAGGELVISAVTRQWSAGISRLAREAVAGGPADSGAADALRRAAEGLAAMRRLLTPAEVVLGGPPNVGKSTLANALVGREVSIVHHTPGTTRDWVREPALLGGVPFWLTDTAGIWADDEQAPSSSGQTGVEAEAVRRARRRVRQADLVCLLICRGQTERPSWCPSENAITVWTKLDLGPAEAACDAAVSAKTGAGLDDLKQAILRATGMDAFDAGVPRAFTDRQAELLSAAAEAIEGADASRAGALLVELLEG